NNQVKANKIDLLAQQYEQFTIPEEESIDNPFAKFNTIITSLKALDAGFSSKNCVRKFVGKIDCNRLNTGSITVKSGSNMKKEVSDEDSSSSDSEDEECGDPNHFIGECSKPPKNTNQRAFIGGVWSDNGEDEVEKTKDEACLIAQAPDEICSRSRLGTDERIKVSGC
ncbi:hypothetical protein Tco_0990485, partial [Tanacetum coccineum]